MKKLTKILAVILLTPILLFGGCFFPTYDEDGDDNGLEFMSGYKVCYKSENYQLDNTFELYATYILQELYANFGIVSDTQKSIMAEKPLVGNVQNYDRIRVQVGSDNSITNSAWKWTFARSLEGAESLTSTDETENYYSSAERREIYLNEFLGTFTTALEIVCIQIAMGETPYTYTVQANESTKATTVYAGTINVNDSEKTLLNQTKELFSQKGDYVGLTTENILALKTYILENIIGTSITNTNDKIYYQNGSKTYSEVLTNILAESPDTLQKSILSPYPTAIIKDITDSSFYVDNDSNLSHVMNVEYQSFVLMPSEEVNLGSLMLAFESDYQMTITVKTDFIQNGTRTNLETQDITITSNKSSQNESVATYMPSGAFDAFENIGNLKSQNAKIINNQNGNNIYYTLNSNNIGILDASQISNSYVEIVFEIDKTQNRDYYPFRVGVQGIM